MVDKAAAVTDRSNDNTLVGEAVALRTHVKNTLEEEQDRNKEIEVSVVIPCLNEEETIVSCIKKALKAFRDHNITGEVVVSDNGSNDNSVALAKNAGARVVHQPEKGYGNAYLKGFDEARGNYIIMGDADDTYDFLEIPKFIEPLRKGYDFVMGTRLKGNILPGAMPWKHRYIGNPLLTAFLNLLFKAKISDSHCGMRGFTKKAYKKLGLKTSGMEFASEMIIKAAKNNLKIKEVPITYYPRKGVSKLSSFKDGWRHLRFMLLFSPLHLFLIPGITIALFGIILMGLLLRGPLIIGDISLDVHPMFIGSLLVILGYQITAFGIHTKIYRVTCKIEDNDNLTKAILKHITLEKGLLLGSLILIIGLITGLIIFMKWIKSGFGSLQEVRLTLVALTLIAIGTQTIFSSFFLSTLEIEKIKQ